MQNGELGRLDPNYLARVVSNLDERGLVRQSYDTHAVSDEDDGESRWKNTGWN